MEAEALVAQAELLEHVPRCPVLAAGHRNDRVQTQSIEAVPQDGTAAVRAAYGSGSANRATAAAPGKRSTNVTASPMA